MAQKKVRLDVLLVERGLCESRERARGLIMAGLVFVRDQKSDKPGTRYDPEIEVEVRGQNNPFVSRGGLKLQGALQHFGLDVDGRVAIDVGASTGGFTDCLLQRGATRVYAVDVGYGQLAWKLRQDERVINLERTNIRTLDPALVPEPVDLAVVDCSFISLRKVLPHVLPLLQPGAALIVLVKPQFEVGKGRVGKGGVVRDETLRQETIQTIRTSCEGLGFQVLGGVDSDTHGPRGNIEHLLYLSV